MEPTFKIAGDSLKLSVIKGIILHFIVFTTLLFQVDAQESCGIQLTCGDCIRTLGCAWCASNSQTFQRARRCDTAARLRARNCDIIEDPHSQLIKSSGSNATSNPINVTNIELSLRVGEPQTFSVTVTPLQDQPLDLYILIDLSASMGPHLNALKESAGQIASRIRGVTDNVRVGFGSFNDKPTRPYTYVPVPNALGSCNIPLCDAQFYAFRHQITLTDNITFYNEAIQGVRLTQNADRPENGLEGLAQVVSCEKIIGWRNRSASGPERGLTRVVLFMTDDAFHYAGEGQLAGILKPYRGECLLDPPPSDAGPAGATEFTRWSEVDYPSVGQIAQMLHDQEVSVIFAVVNDRLDTYRSLSQLINIVSRANVARLEGNATSILNLISNEISQILQEVSLRSDESENLDFTITPSCPTGSAILPNGRGCDNVALQTPVEFQINITLRNCEGFQQSNAPRTHQIVAPGLGSEFLITYTSECECSCAENTTMASDDRCTGNGDFLCGVCECYEGWCGPSCDQRLDAVEDEMCGRGGLNNDICSGPLRGVCRCSCECFDSYFGSACECDTNDDSCPRNANGDQCSGQGDCCDGRCQCTEDRNGHRYRHNGTIENCACPPREMVCNFRNGTECSGNGRCGCSGCICNNGFFGDFCQSRNVGTCGNDMDVLCIEKCVNASFDRDVCMSCEMTRPLLVINEFTATTMLAADLEKIANTQVNISGDFVYELDCETIINSDCTYGYYLLRGSQMYTIILDKMPAFCLSDPGGGGLNLPFEPYIFAPIIFGVLLILGIIIFLLARIIISILDYLEVKRLDKETKDLDFSKNQNPLYQSPDIQYNNVAYGHE